MEAIIYNRYTHFNKRSKPAIMRIDAHNGNARIQLSVEAVKLLQLSEGDCLSFITLPNEKELIYFCVDNKDGFPLRVSNEHKTGIDMGIYCRQLARKLLDHFGINGSDVCEVGLKAKLLKMNNLLQNSILIQQDKVSSLFKLLDNATRKGKSLGYTYEVKRKYEEALSTLKEMEAELLLKDTGASTQSAHFANTMLGECAASNESSNKEPVAGDLGETRAVGQNEQTKEGLPRNVCYDCGTSYYSNERCPECFSMG